MNTKPSKILNNINANAQLNVKCRNKHLQEAQLSQSGRAPVSICV